MRSFICCLLCGILVLSIVSNVNGEESTAMSLLQFMQEESQRIWTDVPRKVLAFYYTWYGIPEFHQRWVHWGKVDPVAKDIEMSTHYPVQGAYDSHDPAVIDRHIDQAKASGIDGFICTWWGQGTFDDVAFGKVLERAEGKGFDLTVYWETAPGKGDAQIDHAVDDLLYLLRQYGSHPAFLKLEGKPVIFVYGRVMNQVPMGAWPAIITRTRREYGNDFLLIADGYRENYARLFDGIHTYNICGWVQKKTPDELRELSASSFSSAVALARARRKISCITIIPGYDDTKIRTPGINAERQDGQTYRVLWEEAIAADPDWVLLTSWNEWHEGSELEPSLEYGETYLDITREYAPRFRAQPPVSVPQPSVGGLTDARLEQLRQGYAGKTIGILPNFSSEVVFWLADVGIQLHELSWDEVVDPERFTPARYPLVIYAAHETYTQSVRETGDVDRAILAYQREGGILMSFASGPFPFYYNVKGEAVVSARKFGFPIGPVPGTHVQSWETAPAGIHFRLKVDNRLLEGLPESALFPLSGDLRWRPSSASHLKEGDVYLPLVTLVDTEGNNYGDGVAYVHHQASEPTGGSNLYVWMGIPKLLGESELFYALFALLLKS